MKKKRRLRPWVKVALTIIAFALTTLLLIKGCENYNRLGQECDDYYGYTCSHYQVEQFARKGGN